MRFFVLAALAVGTTASVSVQNKQSSVQYVGIERNGIELFLGVPYGQDTGGANRFKPARPYVPESGSTIDATKHGPACPQPLGQWLAPLTLNNITSFSENCLHLNVARPKLNETPSSGLPVMVWIHGGECIALPLA